MNVLTGAGFSFVSFRDEPLAEHEWEWYMREHLTLRDVDDCAWVVFFVVQRKAAGGIGSRLIDLMERDVGVQPITIARTRGKYSSVMVGISRFESDDFEFTMPDQQKLWMHAMHATTDGREYGASLFSAEKFMRYDSTSFAELLEEAWEIDSDEYLRRSGIAK